MENLFDDPLILVCGKRAPAADREKFEKLPQRAATVRNLAYLPLVLPEPDAGLRPQFDRAFSEANLFGKLDIVLEVGGWTATLDFVKDGWGIGIVTQSAITSNVGLLEPHKLDLPETPSTAVRLIARQQGRDQKPDLLKEAMSLVELLRR